MANLNPQTRHSLRGTTGKFTSSKPKPTAPGAEGFFNWLRLTKPRILTCRNRYEVFRPTKKQTETLDRILAVDAKGSFLHSVSLLIWPRRHSKTTLFALVVLWLFTTRDNFTVQLLGNHEIHCRRTMFRPLCRIIRNTPVLRAKIPEKDIRNLEIRYKSNIVQMGATAFSGSFGDKLAVLWISDLHACADLEPFNAFQAALLDSQNSLCLIDSNVDHLDSHVHGLQRQAEQDKGIFCDHLEYESLDKYLIEAPPWIDRQKAKRLQSTTLPADFARDILGKRLDARNALFPSDIIELCKSAYRTPVSDLSAITKGRAYKVGGGLDRSKSLVGGDNTVWSVVMKVASPEHGEPEFYLLNQTVFKLNTARAIKRQILQDHERYSLDNVVLENFEVSDIKPFLDDMRISNELISPHDTNQNSSFPEFYRIAKENRLHFPDNLKGLVSEMQTFTYTQKTGGNYSFGHASQKFHDDRVYSLNWAIFSLRSAVMNLYVLGNIACVNKSPKRTLCFIMGGSLEMLCSERCSAFQQIETMFLEFKRYRLDSDLTIQEFYESKVRLEGAKIYQAA